MPPFSYILTERLDSFPSLEDLQSVLLQLKAFGYRGVELNLTPNVAFDWKTLAEFVKTIDLPVVSFLTGANYFAEGLCLCSPQAELRDRAVKRLEECVVIAAWFGALVVIGQMQGFQSDEPDPLKAEARIESCLKRVLDTAEKCGTVLVFEPVNHLQVGFHNTLESVMALIARINSSRLKPMLDSFHMNIEELSITEPICRVGRDLGHFHLCESNGSFLGSGHLDFAALLKALAEIDYGGFASIKVYRQAWKAGAENSIRYLQNLNRGGPKSI